MTKSKTTKKVTKVTLTAIAGKEKLRKGEITEIAWRAGCSRGHAGNVINGRRKDHYGIAKMVREKTRRRK